MFAGKHASDKLSHARSCASGGASNADLLPAVQAGGLAVGGLPLPRPEAAFGAAEASVGLEGAVAMVAVALGQGGQLENVGHLFIFWFLVVKPHPFWR